MLPNETSLPFFKLTWQSRAPDARRIGATSPFF